MAQLPEPEGRWRRALVIVAVVAGALVQARGSFRHAPLHCEDGSILFARSYQEFAFADWWASYNGYVTLLPNAVASLVCRLPVVWIPHAFVMVAALLAAAPALTFLHRGFTPVASWATRSRIALALAWLPLGNHALAGMLSYSLVTVFGWLVLLVLRPGAVRWPAALGEAAVVFALAWSHPLACLLVPVSLVRLARRQRVPAHAACLVGVATFALFGRNGESELHPVQAVTDTLPVVLVRVVFETFCGDGAKVWLWQRGLGWLAIVVGGLAILLVALGCRRGWPRWPPAIRTFVLWGAGLAVAMVGAALLVRGAPTAAESWSQRYVLVPRLLFVAIAMLAGEACLGAWRTAGLTLAVGAGLAVGNRDLYRVPSSELSAFVVHLADEERRLGSRRTISAELLRGDWSIRIVAR